MSFVTLFAWIDRDELDESSAFFYALWATHVWISLLIAVEPLIIFPVLFVERFIAPSTSIAPDSYASVTSTALHKYRSFGLHRPLHNCIAVLVEDVNSLLAVLRVLVVPGGKVILQVHFKISMLGTALPQESVGKVALFGVLICD